jgi:hypothetical protein
MSTGPLNPKAVAHAAMKAGILRNGDDPLTEFSRSFWAAEAKRQDEKILALAGIKLPAEAGIDACIPPPPKPRHLYKKTIPKKSAYVITQKQLAQMGWSRQEIQHIKNEVRSQ